MHAIHQLLITIAFIILLPPMPQAQTNKINTNRCIATLKEAMLSGETFIIKVHAAEALISNHHMEGIDSLFSTLIQEAPANLYGASRVLARVHKNNPAKYDIFINNLVSAFLHADSLRGRLIALESLAKLGYHQPLKEIVQLAASGENGLMGMARWVLANSGKAVDEARLAEPLTSSVGLDYRYAAYSLRFFKKIQATSYSLLQTCNKRIADTDPAKVYVLSSLFVHAGAVISKQAKLHLFTFLNGAVGERYEVAEALALKGTKADMDVLHKLLSDENMDVRVAAANAILKIKEHTRVSFTNRKTPE